MRLPLLFIALVSGCASLPAWSVDSGSQLRRYQDETQRRMQDARPKPAALPELPPSPSRAAAEASTAQVHVAGFEVHGVTRFTEPELTFALKDYIGRALNTADIHTAANALMRHYRNAGYVLAKVFVPPQTFDQIIRLDVQEGYLEQGGIEVQNKGARVATESVQSILEAQIPVDQPLRRVDLERALLIADDLPGTRIGSIIYPGAEVGSARLRSVMSDEPSLSGNIDFDNFNYRQLGQERLGTTLYLNSPGGVGDQVVTRLVSSGTRSNYAYLTYLRPVGSSGTRLGASLDYFNYDADALYDQGEINGHASDARLYLTYPVIRSRYTNLNLRTDFSYYRIVDRNSENPYYVPPAVNPFADGERRITLFQISLSGDESHDALPHGTTLFEVSAAAGKLDITGNADYKVFDASGTPFFSAGPQTEGSFARFNFNVQRLQLISGAWSAYGRIAGQLASGNLDPSQRFYLGGATSLTGYPVAEASGDQGAEIHLELRRDFAVPWGGNLQAGLFYGQGWLQRAKDPWIQGDNNTSLQSVGLQLTQTIDSQWVIRGLIGRQVGSKSTFEKLTGNNSDGRDQSYRVWLQVIRYFGLGGI